VFLIGNSGVGKSSVQYAGVVASLRRQRWPGDPNRPWPHDLSDSRQWVYLSMVPGARPIEALVKAFTAGWWDPDDPAAVKRVSEWAATLREGLDIAPLLDAFRGMCDRLGAPSPGRFVLTLDQAEELFQLNERQEHEVELEETKPEPTETELFFAIVGSAARRRDMLIVASLRTDYYGRFQQQGALFKASTRIDVPPFWDAETIVPVIEQPARLLGVSFQPAETSLEIARYIAPTSSAAAPLLHIGGNVEADAGARRCDAAVGRLHAAARNVGRPRSTIRRIPADQCQRGGGRTPSVHATPRPR
jgi:hypothetical protein